MQAVVDASSRIKQIRDALKISREKLIRRTSSVSIGTLRNAEMGKRVTNESARQITEAFNSILQEKKQAPVTVDDLGLRIY